MNSPYFNVISRNVFLFKVSQLIRSSSRFCSTKSEHQTGNDPDLKEQEIKQKILSASLPFVNQYGWTKDAIGAGAESIGYPATIKGMFKGGGSDLVQYFYIDCNAQLTQRLKHEKENAKLNEALKKEPQEFVKEAVEFRLRLITPYLKTWPQAMAIMALLPNVPTTLANILNLVDDICYYAGDNSVDFNWYINRLSLAGIYKMTELFLIQDTSEDYCKTWAFLDQRIKDALYVQSYLVKTEEVSKLTKETLSAAFITARNILGLNVGNR